MTDSPTILLLSSPAEVIPSPTLNPTSPAPTASPVVDTSSPPSASAVPTTSPTITVEPTNPLTTVSPTTRPTGAPSVAPLPFPTSSPSYTDIIVSDEGSYSTQLFVSDQRKFDSKERFFFESIMKTHTGDIGLKITKPNIKTTCTILRQTLGTVPTATYQAFNVTSNVVLTVKYLMEWTTRYYGYQEIINYPQYFEDHLNDLDTRGATLDALLKAIDGDLAYVQAVGNTVHNATPSDIEMTSYPTQSPTKYPTVVPLAVISMETTEPTTAMPTTPSPSEMPSNVPSIPAPMPVLMIGSDDEPSGYLIGILIACVVVAISTALAAFLRWYLRKQRRLKEGNANNNDVRGQTESRSNNLPAISAAQEQFSGGMVSTEGGINSRKDNMNASVANPMEQRDAEVGTIPTPETDKRAQQLTNMGSPERIGNSQNSNRTGEELGSMLAQTGVYYPTIDSMISLGPDFRNLMESGNEEIMRPPSTPQDESTSTRRSTFKGANLIANRSESFSSESFDETLSSHENRTSGDEFDKYKNQVLEKLRAEVESKIEGVETMMSMAIARIFTDAGNKPLDLAWVGGQDLGSIEASSLCETFEWERQRQSTSSGYGQPFFEEMLNKIVSTVHHGLVRPRDGARILHGCASIIGLTLIQELPNTTLVVQGLVKTNDLAKGHGVLVNSFAPFGDVVDASIAPQNRGFGFVRFVQPKSVEAVLKKHHESEIQIQAVVVSIKTL